MKKNLRSICTVLILISVIPSAAMAQEVNTLYFMDRIPQMSLMNPARQPVCNFYLNMPGISDINMNLGNNSLTYNDIIMESPVNDSLITFLHPDANLDDFLNTLKPKNSFFTQFSTNLLGFGFRAGKGYFSFHAREKSALKLTYPRDLMTFITKGNMKGEHVNLSNLNLYTNHYLEYSLGYSGKMDQDLSYGLRVKYLNGLANFQTSEFNLDLYTSEQADSMSLTSDIELQGTAPVNVTTDSLGYIDEMKGLEPQVSDLFENPGFAIDFGVNYQLMDDLEVSASVTDLGFINYTNYSHRYTVNGEFSYTGIDMSSEFQEEADSDPANDLLDSLQEATKLHYSQDAYLHFLGPKIFLAGNYQLNRKVDFGFLSRTSFFAGDLNQSFTLSANTRPIPGVSFSASYAVMNRAFNNLGLGVGLRLGPFQVYTVSDVVSAGLWPGNTKAFNLRFGLNFVIGCNRMKRILNDKPMIR
ncbi:MAG: DUF5723 family protein [Bacteroidales bacterium]